MGLFKFFKKRTLLFFFLTGASFLSQAQRLPEFIHFASQKAEIRRLSRELSTELTRFYRRNVSVECSPELYTDVLGVSDCKLALETILFSYDSGTVLAPVSFDLLQIVYSPSEFSLNTEGQRTLRLDARLDRPEMLEWFHYLRQQAIIEQRVRAPGELRLQCNPGGQEGFPEGIARCWSFLRSTERALFTRHVLEPLSLRYTPLSQASQITFLNRNEVELKTTNHFLEVQDLEQLIDLRRAYFAILRHTSLSCESNTLNECTQSLRYNQERITNLHTSFALNTHILLKGNQIEYSHTLDQGVHEPLLILPLQLDQTSYLETRISLLRGNNNYYPPCAQHPMHCTDAELIFVENINARMDALHIEAPELGPIRFEWLYAPVSSNAISYSPIEYYGAHPPRTTLVIESPSHLAHLNSLPTREWAALIRTLQSHLNTQAPYEETLFSPEYHKPYLLQQEISTLHSLAIKLQTLSGLIPRTSFSPNIHDSPIDRIRHYYTLFNAPFEAHPPRTWRALLTEFATEALFFRAHWVPQCLDQLEHSLSEFPEAQSLFTRNAHLYYFPHSQIWLKNLNTQEYTPLRSPQFSRLLQGMRSVYAATANLNSELPLTHLAFQSLRRPSPSNLDALRGALAMLLKELNEQHSSRLDLGLRLFEASSLQVSHWVDASFNFSPREFQYSVTHQALLTILRHEDSLLTRCLP